MTTLIPEGLEPLAVWDTRGDLREWEKPRAGRARWWMLRHLVQLSNQVARVEFYALDSPFAIVRRYRLDSTGNLDPGPDGDPVIEPPFIVPLDGLPPEHLLRPA